MTTSRTAGLGLVLVGARGTGKSTVGRIVAERLGRPFFDADAELETRRGKSIRSIFAEDGEGTFRDWEEQTLAELTTHAGAVIATGGGVVLRESNRCRLRDFGFTVWLHADPETLAERIQSTSQGLVDRPPLTSLGTVAEIAAVLEVRIPVYRAVADATVDTREKTPLEVAVAILELWHGRKPWTVQDGSPGGAHGDTME